MNNQKEIESKNTQINLLVFGPLGELKTLFAHKKNQIKLLNENIKSVFSPIRDCVRNCTFQLERISDLFNNELLDIEDLNANKINIELLHFDEKIERKQKGVADFLSFLEQNLDSYQEDLKQTKLAINKIAIISSSNHQNNESSTNLRNINENVEKIQKQICLVEGAIQQFKSKISQNKTECSPSTTNNKPGTAKLKYELIVLLERIQLSSKKQLELTEASLTNLEELSTFLQYEDIIGQKLEHIEEIFQQIIDGLQSWNNLENIEESPYYKLIPDLSALIISHLSLVKQEYHTIMDQISANASRVKNSLEQFSSSAQDTQYAIENKLQVLNDIYHSLQTCLKVYFDCHHKEKNISPYLEYYFTTILYNTYEALVGILDITTSETAGELHTEIGGDKYHDIVTEAKEMMSRIYYSINKIISEKKQVEEENNEGNANLETALSKLQQLSNEVTTEDIKHKTIIYQKSNLSEKLSGEIGLKLEQINKNNLVDTIIDECNLELEKYAKQRSKRKISKTEEGIYDKLNSIYSMDSERKIHQSIMNKNSLENVETMDAIEQDPGSVELF